MEIKVINGVYNDTKDIKPVGTALLDKYCSLKKCENCNEGIAFIEWESGKIKCTQCSYNVEEYVIKTN